MTPGNLELVQVVASWAVTVPGVALIIVRDEKRLTGRELAHAWPPQSRDAAIFSLFYMGIPLCVLVHFARARRSASGFAYGAAWFVAILAAGITAQLGAAAAVDWMGL